MSDTSGFGEVFAQFMAGVFVGVLIFALLMQVNWRVGYGAMLDDCRRANNVYACKIIAVPVEPEEVK